MKVKPIIAALPVMFTLLTGCTADPQTHAMSIQWPFHLHNATQKAAQNGDIIETCIAVNKAELAITHHAMKHAQHKKIRHFAAYLHHAHEKNLHQIRHLSHKTGIAPIKNAEADKVNEQKQRELAELKAVNHAGCDKLFIKDMINDHQEAIRLLDRALMQATNAELIAYLKATRHHVVEHLQRAEMLKKELKLD